MEIILPYIKTHCGKNELIFIKIEDLKFPITSEAIKQLCNRSSGIGGDQVIIYNSNTYKDIRVNIYNNDGSQIYACGNAALCLGYLLLKNKGSILVSTDFETMEVTKHTRYYSITLNYSINDVAQMQALCNLQTLQAELNYKEIIPMFCYLGNQHVCYISNKYYKQVSSNFFEFVEKNPLFSKGTNVEFIRIIESNCIEIKIWERVTGYVPSCATAVAASWLTYNYEAKRGFSKGFIKTPGSLYIAEILNAKQIIIYGKPELLSRGKFQVI